MPSLAVVTPTYTGSIHWTHAPAIASLGPEYYINVSGVSLLAHARNLLAQDAWDTGCDALLWVDADTVLSVDDLQALVRLAEAATEAGSPAFVLSADVPGRHTHGGHPATPAARGIALAEDGPLSRVEAVGHVGLACTYMTRTALGRVRVNSAEYEVGGRTIAEVFRAGADARHYLGEDVTFCRDLRMYGGAVYSARDIRPGHIGPYITR